MAWYDWYVVRTLNQTLGLEQSKPFKESALAQHAVEYVGALLTLRVRVKAVEIGRDGSAGVVVVHPGVIERERNDLRNSSAHPRLTRAIEEWR